MFINRADIQPCFNFILETFSGINFKGDIETYLSVNFFLIVCFVGSAGQLLNMTGHERDVTKGMAYAAVLNIVLNLSLIPWLGIYGAAIATAISLITQGVLLWRLTATRLKIQCSAI